VTLGPNGALARGEKRSNFAADFCAFCALTQVGGALRQNV
jgi:hypothetical protein